MRERTQLDDFIPTISAKQLPHARLAWDDSHGRSCPCHALGWWRIDLQSSRGQFLRNQLDSFRDCGPANTLGTGFDSEVLACGMVQVPLDSAMS